ncbi:MAG: phosphoenolpyruvate carboxykinase (ATP) [Saprospiraceae bacterium]|nr:phosphoenolpyruvate carboxykinase (ATP) [Saprospiraceae bacterium]
MKQIGIKNPEANLQDYGIENWKLAYWNASPNELIEQTLRRSQGTLSHNGTLCIKTGKFTGRSPKDRYIVKDSITENSVDWNDINVAYDDKKFDQLKSKLVDYLNGKDLFIKDGALCTHEAHQVKVRVIAEHPWSAHFVHNMFIRLDNEALFEFEPEWTILVAPGFKSDPEIDETRSTNFSIINFTQKTIIIGGTGYTGEIKKGMFSVLNYTLPTEKDILSMHCSANVGQDGETAVFFGLSGTGKTTLSADPERRLVGDDEHGWSDEGLFNFEGGCYAKCIGLKKENEPDIFNAIKPGAILENISFHKGSCRPDYNDKSITENTRVSYPIYHIKNRYENNLADHPKNIFFLTCDAFGILPPLSKLTISQAMYYFISGYTAKVAGTEEGVAEPKATFSACFGAPFLPLHPNTYAQLLGEKLINHNVNIWLVNTGWIGGPYGVGNRIALKHTRRLIKAVLNGELKDVSFTNLAVFDLKIPSFCPEVPGDILHPRNSWKDKSAYNTKRIELANLFIDNFEQFGDQVDQQILEAAPQVSLEMAAQ